MLGQFARRLIQTEWISNLVEAIPGLRVWVNRMLINSIVRSVRTRPHPWSTVYDYVSWRGLSDRTWSARHLQASDKDVDALPDADALTAMFARGDGPVRLCPKSTLLFPTFAQYLTDGFIRTKTDESDPDHLKRTTSNHQIDLCPLYGLNRDQTLALRVENPDRPQYGRLKSQLIGNEEFPPFLYAGDDVDPEFENLDPPVGIEKLLVPCQNPDPAISGPARKRRGELFAVGGDRANSVPQVAMMNTLLLREHNRLAGEFVERNPDWNDDRVFETARNVVIVEYIKIVVEEYINHIAPLPFTIRADPAAAWDAPWNKPNWITTEFSLLYRWHPLIPDQIQWGDKTYDVRRTFFNNGPLIDVGLAQGFTDMSRQPAGALGAFNTTKGLLDVEKASILQDRDCRLAPFVAYQDYIGRDRPKKISEISSNPEVVALLDSLYKGEVEDVEYFIGLFAEDRVENSPLPQTILTMVAIDAFSQALTNPLLSKHVFKEETFSPYGWAQLNEVSTLADLLRRNVPDPQAIGQIGMTRSDWRYGDE